MKEIEIKEVGSFGDDLLRARADADRIVIEAFNPWSGDTEAGFGRDASVTLTKDQARQLAAFLLEHSKP